MSYAKLIKDKTAYAEIINNEITQIHDSLPQSYRNISNFFALGTEELADLSWSGNDDVRFYECIVDKLEAFPSNSVISGPTYSINHDTKKVVGTYEIHPIAPSPLVVPDSISARQIRLWLIQQGISLDSVTNSIMALENQMQRDSLLVEWEYAPYIERSHPMLGPLALSLGLTEEDINRAFIEASLI